MKKTFIKYGFGFLASLFLLTACETKFPKYVPGANEGVISWYSSGTTFPLTAQEDPLVITLQRGLADNAVSVPISLEDEKGVFTLSNSTIDFAVGEFSKTVEITYSYSTLVPGTVYSFVLAIPEELKSAGGWNEYQATAMMELQYEDYKECSYFQYVYKSGSWIYVSGANFPEFQGTKAKLERAKGTKEYYRLSAWGGWQMEFKVLPTGGMEVQKYAGYNDAGTLSSSGRYTVRWGDGYYFQNINSYGGIYTDSSTSAMSKTGEINTGNVIEFSGWWQKNGVYFPVSTVTGNTYQDFLVE